MRSLIRTARPKQWMKNALVFAAPGAAGALDQVRELGMSLLAFVALCLAASGTYFWNDIADVESDRAHPTKRRRPIAAGELGLGRAKVAGSVLLAGSIACAALTGRWQAIAVVVAYIAITLTYSAFWKHVAVIDLIAIAAGFVLRAAAGAYAADVPMSTWFVLVTTFGALFVVTGKRFAESRELGAEGHAIRSTLAAYSASFVRFVLSVSCTGALVSYCVWALEARDLSGNHLPFYELSVVPVLAAFMRYALLLEQGRGAAPEDVFAGDRVLQYLGVLWVVVFGLAVYAR